MRNPGSGRAGVLRACGLVLSVCLVVAFVHGVTVAVSAQPSITSTSQNRAAPPGATVSEQPFQGLLDYVVLAANDLGMHCGDLDQRIASILPPFNVLHAQVVRKGPIPQILGPTQAEVVYSAASNPRDPSLSHPVPSLVYRTNFWDPNPRGTGHSIAFDAFDAYYPPGVLAQFSLVPDVGLPVPDLQRLYLGDGQLTADQQAMPSATAPLLTDPYAANVPQRFALYYKRLPFFIRFPFGYTQTKVNWFSAEGIPATPFDDSGRLNAYPLMRIQARAVAGNSLGLSPGTVMSSLDTVTPVSGEVDCKNCHTLAADGGNGLATSGIAVATRTMDPLYGSVPAEVSVEYAYDLNVLRLHDRKHGTALEGTSPVSCQKCHYTPALDLAHVGPQGGDGANGREQTVHQSFSRVMHSFHGKLTVNGSPLFTPMPSPVGRSAAVRDQALQGSCYQCHPGRVTQCFRGAMYNAGLACQDCHGNMEQVGNDFSKNVSAATPGAFIVAGDFYKSGSSTPRVPWANEPLCQSCHTGDVNNNLASVKNVVRAADGLRLVQAYRTNNASAKPIVASNRRFAENRLAGKQVLYRLSRGHGGIFCEGCHGSTHAEWPNRVADANDNVAATELQGHDGKLMECRTCHGSTAFPISKFKGNFDASGWMKGPHGMHPVDDPNWNRDHKEVFEDGATPAGTCQACHGARLEGSVLAKLAADRLLPCDEGGRGGCQKTPQGNRILLRKGTVVSCTLCHEDPRSGD